MRNRTKGLKYKTKEYDWCIYDKDEHLLAVLNNIEEVMNYTDIHNKVGIYRTLKGKIVRGYIIYRFEKEDESELI